MYPIVDPEDIPHLLLDAEDSSLLAFPDFEPDFLFEPAFLPAIQV